MQNDEDQADPLAASSREFSRAVDEIKAGVLAAGEPRPKISEEERASRQAAVDYARNIERSEGLEPSPELEEDSRRYVAGELTPDEFNAAGRERARRKAAIDYARGSVRFEGFVLSPEMEEINRRYIAGELTLDEFIEAGKAAAKA